ncbi:NAD(P)-binding protein [Aminicella lysinilytica]|uniref:NADPH-dependent glutamate synthase beta subunit-like oxidoreductase n=1 Tax=Aminicella lysinilytica TaxID=433323 RepID=A0A4R6QDN8_9FIRM|nr:NAD(P)-binding protein [Aminicella lysinilytica]TDP60505.1 NADPH-dependent glutamate synthase beta subunit-like oxidoreductase [Aminicella lysinilytica]
MSRLEFKKKSQAQKEVEGLYRDLERRVVASPPGQCPVDMTGSFLKLCQAQSCGKCVPCRVGVGQLINIIDGILNLNVESSMEDLALLQRTAEAIKYSSDCAIGSESAELVLKGLKSFREDYVSHVERNRCSDNLRDRRHSVPCVAKCPAEVDIPGYMALIKEGRYDDAVRLIRKDNPFPTVCALICEHPCEGHCRRNMIDAPINIRGMKMFAVDNCSETVPVPAPMDNTGKRVAIVGGGPSGLTAAYYLALMGHKPTIFEKRKQLGGMLRYGIPSYRLPRQRLDWDIQSILDAGIEVKLNVNVDDENSIKELIEDYDAAYVAIGAHNYKMIGIDGEESEGVYSAVDLLREIGDEHLPDYAGKRVAVVGGGNVAMDVARTAMRLGASHVDIVYRRRKADMTALPEEIEGAIAEGCRLLELRTPVRIEADETGKVTALIIKPQKVGPLDASGRPKSFPAQKDEQVIPCEIIIGAIGQEIDSEVFEKAGVSVLWKKLNTDTSMKVIGMEGVFAGGDSVTGPSSAVNAIAQGKVAAANIDNYLGYNHEIECDVEIPDAVLEDKTPCGRSELTSRYPDERNRDFNGFENGLLLEEAIQEAGRCLRCDRNSLGAFRGGRQIKW